MNISIPIWLGLGFVGLILGLWIRPKVILRTGFGLALLCGLGLVMSNVSGAEGWGYWFGVGMAAVLVVFGTAALGALIGRLVRRMVGGVEEKPREREYNSVLD